jgi:hypothetical protein
MAKYITREVVGLGNCVVNIGDNRIVETVENLVRDKIILDKIKKLIDDLQVYDDIAMVIDIIDGEEGQQ